MVSLNTGLQQVQNNVLQKISSGNEVNKAADDASGLAIADNLRTQSSSLVQSIENANAGIALSNIAQQGISSQKELLENIKTETLKALNGTTSEEGTEAIAQQINKYIDEFENIADQTNYNGISLLKSDGSVDDDLSIVSDQGDVSIERADTLSVSDQLRSYMTDFVTNPDSMKGLLEAVDTGIDTISSYEGEYGSASNQLESLVRNYMTADVNTQAARSTIIEGDIAESVSDFNKTNIQSQAGYFAQSQANAVQSRVVTLLS